MTPLMHFSHHFFKGSCFQNVQGLSVFKVNFLSLTKKYSGAFIILSEASHASHYHFIWSFFIHIFFHKSDICYVQSVMFTPRVARCAKHAGVVENMVSC